MGTVSQYRAGGVAYSPRRRWSTMLANSRGCC